MLSIKTWYNHSISHTTCQRLCVCVCITWKSVRISDMKSCKGQSVKHITISCSKHWNMIIHGKKMSMERTLSRWMSWLTCESIQNPFPSVSAAQTTTLCMQVTSGSHSEMCYVAILAYKEHICKLNDGNKVFKVSDRQYTWFIICIFGR